MFDGLYFIPGPFYKFIYFLNGFVPSAIAAAQLHLKILVNRVGRVHHRTKPVCDSAPP